MEKIKWHYDKKFKQWWVNETVPLSNDGFTIEKTGNGKYELIYNHTNTIGVFKKLSSAKTVANILRNG